MRFIAGFIVCLALGLPAGAAVKPPVGPFLCIVEQSTGFAFDNQTKSWHHVHFGAGQKLILKRTDKSPHEVSPGIHVPVSGVWGVWAFGDDHWPVFICQNEFNDYGYLSCEGAMSEHFSFHLDNHRFITDTLFGYIQAGSPAYVDVDGKPLPEGSNTPNINIGTCAAL